MISIDRLMSDLARLGEIGAVPGGGVSRPAMSTPDCAARGFLAEAMAAAGLSVQTDAAGNILGRWGSETAVAPVLTGSHIDTIECGGRFDGALGVLGALECVRSFRETGAALHRPIEIVAFNDEEERFLPFLGSRAMMGELTAEDIDGVLDRDGVALADALTGIGRDPSLIAGAAREPHSIAAFVELHIEQGPRLEREGAAVGIVEGIKGDYRWEIVATGRTDHAGAPQEGRADAFMALHGVLQALRLDHEVRAGDDGTFTVGRFALEPNIETAQPGEARCSVDFRSSETGYLAAMEQALHRHVRAAETAGGVRFAIRDILREDPVAFDPGIRGAARGAAGRRGYAWRDLPSGAGHDAQILGRHVPAAMIFVPSVGGRSHCPEEFTHAADIERGVTVLHDTLLWLATREPGADREPRLPQ